MFPRLQVSSHPVDVGQRTEAVALAELVRRGYRVLVPFGVNQRYDLVVDVEGQMVRAQCKTGRLVGGRIVFNAQSIRSNARASRRRDYVGELDVFIVYCPQLERIYAVPVDEATRSVGCLRVEPPGNGVGAG